MLTHITCDMNLQYTFQTTIMKLSSPVHSEFKNVLTKEYIDAKGNSWYLSGYSEIIPSSNNDPSSMYFPYLAERRHSLSSQRVISVCIPCYNEGKEALGRTIASLHSLKIPPGFYLEVAVITDGMERMSPSMKSYLNDLFGVLGDKTDNEEADYFLDELSLFSGDIETIMVERASINAQDGVSLSLILKRNNHGKVNSHMWWLGSHSISSQAEYLFATDCGICFDSKMMEKQIARLESDKHLSAVTGCKQGMSSKMQGDGDAELFTNPFGYVLRQLQRFDFETENILYFYPFDSIGFLPVSVVYSFCLC